MTRSQTFERRTTESRLASAAKRTREDTDEYGHLDSKPTKLQCSLTAQQKLEKAAEKAKHEQDKEESVRKLILLALARMKEKAVDRQLTPEQQHKLNDINNTLKQIAPKPGDPIRKGHSEVVVTMYNQVTKRTRGEPGVSDTDVLEFVANLTGRSYDTICMIVKHFEYTQTYYESDTSR